MAADKLNPYASFGSEPAHAPYQPADATGGDAWANGKSIIIRKDSRLPPTCVKTGQPLRAEQLVLKKLSWNPGWVWILFFLGGLIPLVIAVMITRKTGNVWYGVSEEALASRRKVLAIAWCVGLLGAVLIALPIVIDGPDMLYALIAVGILVVLGALLYGSTQSQFLRPSKIDKQFIWLKGAHPELLAQLPPWAGAPS